MDLTAQRQALMPYSYQHFAQAKDFVFRRWGDMAEEGQRLAPTDLSGACKYGSLFTQQIFGGTIQGHYQHQFNRVDGRLVDLSHDARDVGLMLHPYLHEAGYFEIPEYQAQLSACLPRVEAWVAAFLLEMENC